ncbi:hypothetical protein Tco_1378614 [Tanacetum coccineum]
MVVAISTVLVLVPTILIVGLVVVLYGRKTGWSDLVRHRWRTVTGISLVKICCGCLRDVFLDVISGAGAGIGYGDVCVEKSTSSNHMCVQFSGNIGDTPEVEALRDIRISQKSRDFIEVTGCGMWVFFVCRRTAYLERVSNPCLISKFAASISGTNMRPRIPRWEPGAILP